MTNQNANLPASTSGRFTSPDLQLRDSAMLWGPLHLTISTHRESADLGYLAGIEAYQEQQRGGWISLSEFEYLMGSYLEMPAFRPRCLTPTITREWEAMFLLGWSQQLLLNLDRQRQVLPPLPRRRYHPPGEYLSSSWHHGRDEARERMDGKES